MAYILLFGVLEKLFQLGAGQPLVVEQLMGDAAPCFEQLCYSVWIK